METHLTKPMLAAAMDADKGESLETLKYPVYATQKVDGIRALVSGGVVLSRTLKPIPNHFIQSILGRSEYNGLDGELLVGHTFQQATSGIMSEAGEPDFTYYVFDRWDLPGWAYVDRCLKLKELPAHPRIEILQPRRIENSAQLAGYTEAQLALGFEGAMVRSADGPYKNGRATFKEGYLTKVKMFEDDEATVVGMEERMHNGNEAKTNALGRTERSSHKANLRGLKTMGALQVSHPTYGDFNIGTGFDDAQRQEIWNCFLSKYNGRKVKFRYQKIGTKDKPRCPVFLGFRSEEDIS